MGSLEIAGRKRDSAGKWTQASSQTGGQRGLKILLCIQVEQGLRNKQNRPNSPG